MATTSPLRRAAQYLRMSTEQQQYSTENQKDAICAYAALRGIEIVATYEDAGKSGLTLAKRPSLRKLIADVVAEKVEFDSILVYDVSRWGRFQDADESAHLEYICRMAGVHVEYCAEPFSNDGTPFSNICKVVKRALAAEYSRELSTKVYAGKRRLIQLGFRQGGSAGFGFRRCLIDELGKRKGLLSRGIRKSIMTDRVILVPGPPKEIAIVRRIYRDYAERHIGTQNIADTLNQEGVRSESGRPWSKAVVKNVLTSEKYIGNSVWGRSSIKIGERPHRNTPDQWTRYENAYEGIVSRSLFEKAQTLRAKRSRKWSDDEIVSLLKSIYAQHGAITTELIREQGGIRADAIRDRFGGLYCAYKRIGFCPRRNLDFVALDCASAQLRTSTAIKTIEIIRKCGGTLWRVRDGCLYVINGEIRTSLAVSKERYKRSKKPLWRIKIGGSQDDLTLAAQMVGSNSQACAYYFFPSFEIGNGIFLSKENPVLLEAFRFANLDVLTRICARIDLSAGLGIAQPVPSCTIEHGCQRLGTFLPPSMKKKRFRVPSEKSYRGSFLRASRKLRAAITAADDRESRLKQLRQTLISLFNKTRFVRLLASQEISNFPSVLVRDEEAASRQIELFRSELRKRALALFAGKDMAERTRCNLKRIKASHRIEAVEFMILANENSEYAALAMVAASSPRDLMRQDRKRTYHSSSEEHLAFVEEHQIIFREAKRALALYGFNSLDLMSLSAFVRRLLVNEKIAKWLASYNPVALKKLRLHCALTATPQSIELYITTGSRL